MSAARILLLALFSLTFATGAQAQERAKRHRSVKYGSNTADLQFYTCDAGKAGSGELRVSFYRVSEMVAGALVMGTPLPAIDPVVGPVKFVDNNVYQEIKTLFGKFGVSRSYEPQSTINVSITPEGTPPADATLSSIPVSGKDDGGDPVKIWSLSSSPAAASDSVLLKAPSEVVLNTDHWPTDYNMDYRCAKDRRDYISCTQLHLTNCP
jgi:hypothetical protein